MSNTSSSSSINFALLNQAINRYVPIPFMFFGIIGNILNILIFTRRVFRNNVCVTYFLASTTFNSLAIIVGLLPRTFSGFNIDPSQYSAALCKLRLFSSYFSGYAAAWFTSLACIERYLSSSTSVYRRQLITMRRAYYSMILVVLFGFMAFGEQFYCIDINQQLYGAPQSCYQLKKIIPCQIVDSLMQLIFEILMPALIMLIFGFLTFRNVRQQRRRINVVQITHIPMTMGSATTARYPGTLQQSANLTIDANNQSSMMRANRTAQKRDAQLITMLLVQVLVFIITTVPISIYKLYSIATIDTKKSILRVSIENTIFNLSVISLFINNTIVFYIYTLSGTVFRKELMKLFRLTQ